MAANRRNAQRRRVCAAAAALLAASPPRVAHGARFTDYSVDAGLSSVLGTVAALGDWDGDKRVDLLVVPLTGSSIEVYLLHESGDFRQWQVDPPLRLPAGSVVANVIPSDFNYDARLDVLVQHYVPSTTTQDSDAVVFENTLFLQGPRRGSASSSHEKKLPRSLGPLLALNFYGAPHTDLFGTLWDDSGEKPVSYPQVWRNLACHGQDCLPEWACGKSAAPAGCIEAGRADSWQPFSGRGALRGWSATVDLDGDCRADFVFAFAGDGGATELQLLRAESSRGGSPFAPFQHGPQQITLAPAYGQPSWVDIDADGDIDMVLPLCTQPTASDCAAPNGGARYDAIAVAKNMQASPGCHGQSCCDAQPFSFPDLSTLDFNSTTSGSNVIVTCLHGGRHPTAEGCPPGGVWVDQVRLGPKGLAANLTLSPVFRFGDHDNDAHADILTVGTTGKGARQVQLWGGNGEGSFALASGSSMAQMMTVADPVAAFFIDVTEDGISDIMVLSAGGADHIFSNGQETGNLFFKALGLNGACGHSCSSGNPYGVNMPGVTHAFSFQRPHTLSVSNVHMAATQLTQSTNLALQRPYATWGLGKTNSYVQVYSCGIHVASLETASKSWPALLPNSQVIVIPHPPDKPSEWTLELFVSPSRLIKWVALTVAVTLALLAFPILYLRWEEHKEDFAERNKDPIVLS
eukprot:TRINITY_DN16213_c0_g1_i1.p1 TRINITY_DN16213_c0_g1~~TRINITY_DN16213_c0_g1_i1.p1  ORF type:complete len:689 (+),score=134.84 TRINITY_DN16213_c0_g1_i1:75-2141(+)